MSKQRGNSKAKSNDDGGPSEALNQSGKERPEMGVQSVDSQAVLAAIASLQAELSQAKSDICNKIDERIAEVSTTLRGELAALKSESDSTFLALNVRMDSQSETLKSLGESASATSDIVVELEAKVKQLHGQVEQQLHGQVEQLSDKCIRTTIQV